ncbi:hypothetical protein ACMU_05690 [Actibacterium mucosum KCTC 23349]|uniref:OmpA-like domain-containing protein n=1 Tax=Actibacterium mucosum KCTC 23349 TaxID=1454373 RepID=A0A037ZLD8_9RHOB|nr:OmpA family protein [Actibacterium mucosum]KAJ56434.1 hypothetical protein ACMU_05690 [Actibacterium mucosum KCTC 23349]
MRKIGFTAALVLSGLTPAMAEVGELSVSADYCTILRAFTDAASPECPAPTFAGRPRGLQAAPPGLPEVERGYFVRFAFDSADLTPAFQDHLKSLSTVFASGALQDLCFKLVGHTDTRGAPSYNMALSHERAKSVRLFLAALGQVDIGRVQVEGRGETEPLTGRAGDDAYNRRVEILARPAEGAVCNS